MKKNRKKKTVYERKIVKQFSSTDDDLGCNFAYGRGLSTGNYGNSENVRFLELSGFWMSGLLSLYCIKYIDKVHVSSVREMAWVFVVVRNPLIAVEPGLNSPHVAEKDHSATNQTMCLQVDT